MKSRLSLFALCRHCCDSCRVYSIAPAAEANKNEPSNMATSSQSDDRVRHGEGPVPGVEPGGLESDWTEPPVRPGDRWLARAVPASVSLRRRGGACRRFTHARRVGGFAPAQLLAGSGGCRVLQASLSCRGFAKPIRNLRNLQRALQGLISGSQNEVG